MTLFLCLIALIVLVVGLWWHVNHWNYGGANGKELTPKEREENCRYRK